MIEHRSARFLVHHIPTRRIASFRSFKFVFIRVTNAFLCSCDCTFSRSHIRTFALISTSTSCINTLYISDPTWLYMNARILYSRSFCQQHTASTRSLRSLTSDVDLASWFFNEGSFAMSLEGEVRSRRVHSQFKAIATDASDPLS